MSFTFVLGSICIYNYIHASFVIASQCGLENQSEQTLDELAELDDESPEKTDNNNECEDNKEETDPSDRAFQISKWLTRFSLAFYIVAIILTVWFVVSNPIGPKSN